MARISEAFGRGLAAAISAGLLAAGAARAETPPPELRAKLEQVIADGAPGAAGLQAYGLGNWCETSDAKGRCGMVSSPGAFGTYPWIDRGSGLYGVFFLRGRLPLVVKDLTEARLMILAADRAAGSP